MYNAGYEWGYQVEQGGILAMGIFLGFLSYLIVKFKAFDIKLIGAQALVLTQFALISSMFFFATVLISRVLIGVTLFGTTIAGWYLIRSVKAEIKRKEELEKISHTLMVANERLKELDAAKSEFISIASHQLRTPLTAIKGYLSLLLEGSYGPVSPQVLDILNKLYGVNNRLVHLVEDLLNVSRIEAGRIQYSFAPTQIEPILVELVDMFLSPAQEKNLTIDIHLSKHPLPLITMDPNKIKEVVSNLIDNAVKYTKVGGVTVTLQNTPEVARIIISDTGIGIHESDKKNLFQKFLRSKETTKMVVSGAGLGLYVGKSFIEAHGGKIWAESDGPDRGSRFIIELPIKNTHIQIGTSDEPTSVEKE
ncbi:MAG: HAMP domain-containing sensor histidine kinase [Candidatus Moranbacteria bacterium]|nr:HAMP domain-containing sensor histidine kinase [Candidatus Moranbacteria bacterium]MDD3964833.1 HAMP domain-containing sensor histidine kinase [Candidatus Moranbacteria bacterium]